MEMPVPSQHRLDRKSELVLRLRAALPADCVIDDPMETRAYECDALSAYRCPPMAVVLPYTTEQVAQTLKICHDLNIPVVPRGSGTSLAGGLCPPPTALFWACRG